MLEHKYDLSRRYRRTNNGGFQQRRREISAKGCKRCHIREKCENTRWVLASCDEVNLPFREQPQLHGFRHLGTSEQNPPWLSFEFSLNL